MSIKSAVLHLIIALGLFLFMVIAAPPSTPRLAVLGGGGSFALAYLATWFVAVWYRHRHIKSQNRLLDRCRALFMVGSRAINSGDHDLAKDSLARIRRLESLWRLGNWLPFRACLFVWAVGSAVLACADILFVGLLVADYGWTGQPKAPGRVIPELLFAIGLSTNVLFFAIAAYAGQWTSPWVLEDCGDRLLDLMYGPRQVILNEHEGPGGAPNFDGLSPLEVFGLPPNFTRRDLDRARRRLVRELHPDRWHDAGAGERNVREEALKRINATYDELRTQL